MHGQFIWYELTTPDPAGAMAFYPTFAKWGMQPFGNDYTMWTDNGQPIGGVFKLTDELRARGVPPNWMPYVEVTDVDDSAALCISLGGQLTHGPEDVPDVGRIAIIQDPHGAVIGIYKPDSPAVAWDGHARIGRMSWNELMTVDSQKAFDFYRRLFGWEKVSEMDMGDGLMYLLFGKGSAMYGGMFSMTDDMQGMHPFWLCYINVKDVPKAVATATEAGARLHRGPMDIPGGVIAILGDPQGAGFALHHVSAPPPAAKKAAGKRSPTKTAKKAVRKAVQKAASKAARKSAKKAAKKSAKKAAKKAAKKRTATKKRAAAKKRAATKKRPTKTAARKRPAKKAARRGSSRRPARTRRGGARKRSRR